MPRIPGTMIDPNDIQEIHITRSTLHPAVSPVGHAVMEMSVEVSDLQGDNRYTVGQQVGHMFRAAFTTDDPLIQGLIEELEGRA